MKVFGGIGCGEKKKKDEPTRRRSDFTATDSVFQNYRRGTTLTNLNDEQRQKTERQKERTLRQRRRKLGGILLIVAVICVLGLLLLSEFNGSLNKISSDSKLSSSDVGKYQKLAAEYFRKNPLERFDFARRDDDMVRFLIQGAPEIKTAEITKSGLMNSQLNLEFRKPLAMFTVADKTNYVDESGIVFAKNFFAEPSIQIIDNSGVGSSDGAMTSTNFLEFVGRVSSELDKKGESVNRVEIPAGAIRYVNFYLADREYPFMAHIDRDPSSQAADMTTMIKYLDQNQITPSYVDCRVMGKAYWK
ncbi:MAG: hypothetical protein LBM09_03255 [Candidatus Nomurabacteria bacterium]|nr:hypothetical protein [Candidatus Nomurabacteria bacterium]